MGRSSPDSRHRLATSRSRRRWPQQRQSRQANLVVGPPTQCVHTGLWRGMLRPLRTPGSRAAAEQRTDGGTARGTAPKPPHRCAFTAQRRTVVIARIERADQALVGLAEALGLPAPGSQPTRP